MIVQHFAQPENMIDVARPNDCNLWCGETLLVVSDTKLKANCSNFFYVLFQLVKAIISSWRAAQICRPYHDRILNRPGINHLAADCTAQGNFL